MDPRDLESVSEPWRSHLVTPLRVGAFDGAAARVARVENGACGDVLELWCDAPDPLRPDVVELRFKGRGCWAVTAVASFLCERLSGRPLGELRGADLAEEVERAGGLPRPRAHVVRLFQRALDEVLAARG
ncbi:NifU-like protein [Planctomycetes bacterium Pla163]|uniref:NifU-like protein n=1 Tax=Rohdeia mirabilis TaxID=2528008 RepID=A0A518D354_9BACT|nr:NifU-like protein [Planctomycetes bacterium Pla163]